MKHICTALLIVVMISGCNSTGATSTPPPGWRVPVNNLFVEVSAFPKSWAVGYSTPKDKGDDPTINHVFREWQGQGRVWQNIWRAYAISDAEDLFDDMRDSQFAPNSTLEPYAVFKDFTPPDQFGFTSQIADEYYFACGVWGSSYCEIVARYRNYVTNVHLPLKSEIENDGGLTYGEMEIILEGMDQQFLEFFETLDQQTREDEVDITPVYPAFPLYDRGWAMMRVSVTS